MKFGVKIPIRGMPSPVLLPYFFRQNLGQNGTFVNNKKVKRGVEKKKVWIWVSPHFGKKKGRTQKRVGKMVCNWR